MARGLHARDIKAVKLGSEQSTETIKVTTSLCRRYAGHVNGNCIDGRPSALTYCVGNGQQRFKSSYFDDCPSTYAHRLSLMLPASIQLILRLVIVHAVSIGLLPLCLINGLTV